MKPLRRASNMDRDLRCPAAPTLEAIVGIRESGAESYEGSMLHWLIASRLIAEMGATPPEGGLKPPKVPPRYQVPKTSLWIVNWAIRHVADTIPSDWALMVEEPVAYEFDRWIASGHFDGFAISPEGTKAHGIDWKAVYNAVPSADDNDQVNTYLALAKRAWPALVEIAFDVCQPRLPEEGDTPRVSTLSLIGDAIDRRIADLDARVCYALDHPNQLETGLRQCRFCVGLACPALQQELYRMKMTLTPELLATIQRSPDDALLGDLLITARTLAKPIEDTEKLLHDRLDQQPEVLAGCGTRISRKIERGAYTVLEPLQFLQGFRMLVPTDADLVKAYSPSMTRVKDTIAEVMQIKKTGKGEITAESIFDGRLRPFVEQGERKRLVFSD